MSCGKNFVSAFAGERWSEDVRRRVNDIFRLILGCATGVATLFLYIDVHGCFNDLNISCQGAFWGFEMEIDGYGGRFLPNTVATSPSLNNLGPHISGNCCCNTYLLN